MKILAKLIFCIALLINYNISWASHHQDDEDICSLLEIQKRIVHSRKKELSQYRRLVNLKEKIAADTNHAHLEEQKNKIEEEIKTNRKRRNSWLSSMISFPAALAWVKYRENQYKRSGRVAVIALAALPVQAFLAYRNHRAVVKHKKLLKEEFEKIDVQKLENLESEFEMMEINLKNQIEDNRNICLPVINASWR